MKTFKEWLIIQETSHLGYPSTSYGQGMRQQEPNLFKRVALDMPSYPAQAIQKTGDAFKSLMRQRGSPGYGYGYIGDQTIGLKWEHKIPSSDPNLLDADGRVNLLLVQYRALESQVYQAQQQGIDRELDWDRTMIGKPTSMAQAGKSVTFKVSIITPDKNAPQTTEKVDYITPKQLYEKVILIKKDALPVEQLRRRHALPPATQGTADKQVDADGSNAQTNPAAST